MNIGAWLTYLVLVAVTIVIVLGWFWIIDIAFDGIADRLRRRHERRALTRWQRIRELEKELNDNPGA